MSVEKLMKRYPQLQPAQVFDALAFAFDNLEVIEADIQREEDILRRQAARTPSRPKGAGQIELPFGSAGAPGGSGRRKRKG